MHPTKTQRVIPIVTSYRSRHFSRVRSGRWSVLCTPQRLRGSFLSRLLTEVRGCRLPAGPSTQPLQRWRRKSANRCAVTPRCAPRPRRLVISPILARQARDEELRIVERELQARSGSGSRHRLGGVASPAKTRPIFRTPRALNKPSRTATAARPASLPWNPLPPSRQKSSSSDWPACRSTRSQHASDSLADQARTGGWRASAACAQLTRAASGAAATSQRLPDASQPPGYGDERLVHAWPFARVRPRHARLRPTWLPCGYLGNDRRYVLAARQLLVGDAARVDDRHDPCDAQAPEFCVDAHLCVGATAHVEG